MTNATAPCKTGRISCLYIIYFLILVIAVGGGRFVYRFLRFYRTYHRFGNVKEKRPLQRVMIIGAGVVGTNAARIALGMGANVTVLDVCPQKLYEIEKTFDGKISTVICNNYNLEKYIQRSDIVIGAVLIPSKKAPHVVSEDMVKKMKKGAVIVDVSIDQGGIFETIQEPTSIDNPVFEKHGVIHYAVPNIPSCVARTATISLNNYIMPYVLKLIMVLGKEQMAVKVLMERLQLRGRANFMNLYLVPAIQAGFVTLLYPDTPRHPRQEYMLSGKGRAVYEEMQR